MISKKALAVATLAFVVAGAAGSAAQAGPEFLTYEGRNAVREGDGGERKTVEGVDFWLRGAPPRKFKILGSLTDRRHETGIYGKIRMATLESDIAKAAKAAGGDAVVLEGEGEEVVGHAASQFTNVDGSESNGMFNATGMSTAFSHAIKKHDASYLVVKYLDDGGATPASPPQ